MKRSRKTAEDIRREINARFLRPAFSRGENEVVVEAGKIDVVNIPNVCQAMTGQKIQDQYSVGIKKIQDNRERVGADAKPSTLFWVTYDLASYRDPQNETQDSGDAMTGTSIATPDHLGRYPSISNGDGANMKRRTSSTIEDKLKALKTLKNYADEGIITKEEFESKKKEILDRLLKEVD